LEKFTELNLYLKTVFCSMLFAKIITLVPLDESFTYIGIYENFMIAFAYGRFAICPLQLKEVIHALKNKGFNILFNITYIQELLVIHF